MGDYAFSIDLGGTTVNFSVFNSHEIISVWTIKTQYNKIIDMLEHEINCKIKDLKLKSTDFKAIVLGIAGIVKNNIVVEAINLNLSNINLGEILESRVNIKTIVLNDVNLQAIGESVNYNNLFLITIGTGIEGYNGMAGEIGHINIDSKTPEENTSARGLVNTLKNYSGLDDYKNLTVKDIFRQAETGDEVAFKIIYDTYFNFGKLLAVMCSAFDPEIIIISGGVSNAGDLLLKPIKDGFNTVAFGKTEIILSKLKEKAAIYGAMKITDEMEST